MQEHPGLTEQSWLSSTQLQVSTRGQVCTHLSVQTFVAVAQLSSKWAGLFQNHIPLTLTYFLAQRYHLLVQMTKISLQAITHPPIIITFQQLHVKGKSLEKAVFHFIWSVFSLYQYFILLYITTEPHQGIQEQHLTYLNKILPKLHVSFLNTGTHSSVPNLSTDSSIS